MNAVLRRLLEVAREVTGARYAAVGVLDDRLEEVERFVTAGVDAETSACDRRAAHGRGILGLLIEDPRRLRLEHIGEHPQSYGFPAGHPEMETFLGVPVVIREVAWGNLYLTEKEERRAVHRRRRGVRRGSSPTGRRSRSTTHGSTAPSRQRRDHLERAVRGLDTTVAIARALGGETDLNRILELIVKRGTGAGWEAGGAVDPPRTGRRARGRRRRGRAAHRDPWSAHVDKRNGGRPGRALAASPPRRGTHGPNWGPRSIALASRPTGGADRAAQRSAGAPSARLPRSRPARRGGRVRRANTNGCSARSPPARQPPSSPAARSRSSACARASRRPSKSVGAGRASALHDETLQALAGAAASASRRRAAARRRGAARGGAMSRSRSVTEEIANLRALIVELRPAALDEVRARGRDRNPRRADVRSARASPSTRTSTSPSSAATSRCGTPPSSRGTVYRLVQEALTNAVRARGRNPHPDRRDGARRGGWTSRSAMTVAVSILGNTDSDGFGLTGMRERVELAGGELDIGSGPSRHDREGSAAGGDAARPV